MANNIMTSDLVVVGGGGSGLVAAVKAKVLGVQNVIVLEAAKAFPRAPPGRLLRLPTCPS